VNVWYACTSTACRFAPGGLFFCPAPVSADVCGGRLPRSRLPVRLEVSHHLGTRHDPSAGSEAGLRTGTLRGTGRTGQGRPGATPAAAGFSGACKRVLLRPPLYSAHHYDCPDCFPGKSALLSPPYAADALGSCLRRRAKGRRALRAFASLSNDTPRILRRFAAATICGQYSGGTDPRNRIICPCRSVMPMSAAKADTDGQRSISVLKSFMLSDYIRYPVQSIRFQRCGYIMQAAIH